MSVQCSDAVRQTRIFMCTNQTNIPFRNISNINLHSKEIKVQFLIVERFSGAFCTRKDRQLFCISLFESLHPVFCDYRLFMYHVTISSVYIGLGVYSFLAVRSALQNLPLRRLFPIQISGLLLVRLRSDHFIGY